jgi:hypothetical protein
MTAELNGEATVLDHALAYNRHGISTIPVKADGTKMPDVSSWREYAETRPSELQVKSWHATGDRGIALIHGEVSGGTEVIDLDLGDLLDPFVEALDHAAPGLYQKLCVIQTPRPGYHLYYRCDTVQGNQKLARRPATADEIAAAEARGEKAGPVTLIETRGRNGYTLAPGSPGACHETGRTYQHFEGPGLDNLQRITPEERQALLWAARSLDQMPVEEPKLPPVTHNGRAYDGESPGDAYARTVTFADILEPHGWDCVGASGDRLLWRRPGKTEGISATTGNISKQGNELLCVFSTNADPFGGPDGSRQCSTHTKFDAYARLNHGGDYSAAAKELARIGYGDKPRVEYADHNLRDQDPSAAPREQKRETVTFNRITCAELANGDYSLEFLVDDILVKGQPGLLAGPPKGCKTTALIDLAISLTTATRFLNRFDVSEPVRVAVMTGESGLATIQETARRVCESRGLRLEDNANLFWYADVPRFGDPEHIEAVRKLCVDDAVVVLLIDPAYLAMPGANADNLMMQGELLRSMAKACAEIGVTLLLAHHTKKNTITPSGDPLELHDIAWAGFAEFARQWLLLNRRERYEEGTGEHHLWLSVGGSAGHSGLYGVDISEGTWSPTTPRWWDVTVQGGGALLNAKRQEHRDRRDVEKEQKTSEKLDHDRTKVWAALGKFDGPETSSAIAGAAGLSGGRTAAALGWLVAEGFAEQAEVVRANRQKYSGYQLTSKGVEGGGEGSLGHPDSPGQSDCLTVETHTLRQTPIGGLSLSVGVGGSGSPPGQSTSPSGSPLIGEPSFHDFATGAAP